MTTLTGGRDAKDTYDNSYSVKAHAYAQASSTAGAASSLSNIPTWATLAWIIPSAAVRYRCDGVAPTSSIGMPMTASQAWPIQGAASIAAFQVIGNATLDIEYRG